MQNVTSVTPTLERPSGAPSGTGIEAMSDRDLDGRYWRSRRELESLREIQAEHSGLDMPGFLQRMHELDARCRSIWNESRRRAVAGTPSADA